MKGEWESAISEAERGTFHTGGRHEQDFRLGEIEGQVWEN